MEGVRLFFSGTGSCIRKAPCANYMHRVADEINEAGATTGGALGYW